ncbi:MAG: hypothetical protein HYS32_02510 [Candidatus Woesearchaeota archaeon]|nr:MAG: hypothetical protein HYS32_02510 [Candidatus Woesearchaeota archaeon]
MRTKALFLIYLVVFSIFSIYLISPISAAQFVPEENTAQGNIKGQVCCEVTNSGDTCVYTSASNCAPGSLKASTTCEQTSFCQTGCAIDKDEGLCFKNTPKASAEKQNQTWVDSPLCEVPQCQKGCCVLNNEFSFITQARCEKETSAFPDLKVDFREDITTEQACLEESLAKEEGCCAIDQNTCTFGTRSECLNLGGDDPKKFKKNTLCSNPELSCECTPRHHKGIFEGKVFWFDSCSNREEVFQDGQQYTGFVQKPTCTASPNDLSCGNCDYTQGNIASKVGDGPLDFECVSVNCATTTEDANTEETGSARKNGESWCIFDDREGPGQDRVGSRYYRYSCILGEEINEECEDFRREFCLQGGKITSSGTFTEAKCKQNNFEACENAKSEEQCTSELVDCQWIGTCVPLVAPGFKFWEDEGADRCASVSGSTTLPTEDQAALSAFVGTKNRQCEAMGDCGSKLNWAGAEGSGEGFSNSEGIEVTKEAEGIKEGLGAFGKKFLVIAGLFVLLPIVSRAIGQEVSLGGTIGTVYKSVADKPAFTEGGGWSGILRNPPTQRISENFQGNQLGNNYVRHEGQWYKTSTTPSGGLREVEITEEAMIGEIKTKNPELAEELSSEGTIETVKGSISPAKVIDLALTLYVLYSLYQALTHKTEEETQTTISVSCNLWQAPTGGADCGRCNEDPLRPCTEYRCRSLGQLCELVNAGTGNETCVSISPKDSNSPVITADKEVLSEGFTLTETTFPGGFEGFKINEVIQPFKAIEFGITTDEPSQCKLSTEPTTDFDLKPVFFPNDFFTIEHKLRLNLPLDDATKQLDVQNGKDITLFVRCQDKVGNKNAKDYFIQFRIQEGPDLTAPVIEATSLPNNAQIPFNTSSTDFSVFANEPVECKYSNTIDLDYDVMTKIFTCNNEISQAITFFGLFECKTKLTDLKPKTDNTVFIRCRDQPNAQLSERNTNTESEVIVLKPSDPLKIASKSPEGDIFTDDVTLQLTTTGGAEKDGTAQCGFSTNQREYILFAQTNSSVHKQNLVNLEKGDYTYFFQCIDLADNVVSTEVKFKVTVDNNPPQIINIYKDTSTATSLLHLVTDESSTCEYTTTGRFSVGQGKLMTGTDTKDHDAVLDSEVYFIRCKDSNNNQSPLFTIYI